MAPYCAKAALLGNRIDYAGTFPPAALSLEKAMQEACTFRGRAGHPWLLARVVVTIDDLKKCSPRAWFQAGSNGTPVPITVIGSPVERSSELARTVSFELREVRHFNEKYAGTSLQQWVAAYETRLPDDCPLDETATVLNASLAGGKSPTGLDLDIYYEISLSGEWQHRLAKATRAMSEWCDEHPASAGAPGLKIRTGGKLPPTPDQLAEVVATCTSHGLKFKATQGLHHAVTGGKEFGFANLFAAFAFTQTYGVEKFPPARISQCLCENKASAFRFTPAFLEWAGYRLTVDQIEASRQRHGGTFGSCSLDEPDRFLGAELKEEG